MSVPWLEGRPRRSGAARREQALRSQARAVQKLLAAFKELDQHRGCKTSKLGLALESALQQEFQQPNEDKDSQAETKKDTHKNAEKRPAATMQSSALQRHLDRFAEDSNHGATSGRLDLRANTTPFDHPRQLWARKHVCKHFASRLCKLGSLCNFKHAEIGYGSMPQSVAAGIQKSSSSVFDPGVFAPNADDTLVGLQGQLRSALRLGAAVFKPAGGIVGESVMHRSQETSAEEKEPSEKTSKDLSGGFGNLRTPRGRKATPMPSSRGSSSRVSSVAARCLDFEFDLEELEKHTSESPLPAAGKSRHEARDDDVLLADSTVAESRTSRKEPCSSAQEQCEVIPQFSDEQMLMRTVTLENPSLSCTGQELVEIFNGAILAITQHPVHQAAHRNMAPVFACTVTEEDSAGGGGRRKSAELKFRTPVGASVGMKLNGIERKGHNVTMKRPKTYEKLADGRDAFVNINLSEVTMAKLVCCANTSGSGDYGV